MAYIGIVDLNSKLFTQTNAEIPVGTVVNKLGFVFKDLQNGATKQSADLYANGPTTIINLSAFTPNSKQKSSVVNGQLQTSMKLEKTDFTWLKLPRELKVKCLNSQNNFCIRF